MEIAIKFTRLFEFEFQHPNYGFLNFFLGRQFGLKPISNLKRGRKKHLRSLRLPWSAQEQGAEWLTADLEMMGTCWSCVGMVYKMAASGNSLVRACH